MIVCPYVSKKYEQVHQDTYTYDQDGRTDTHQQKLVEIRTMMECLKENCGAWRNGRCCYYGDDADE